MVIEALEDHRRGWKDGKEGLGGERVARGKFAIEHVLPRKWQTHWPLSESATEGERGALVHTLGNLTLLTRSLNSKVSNSPWRGDSGKRQALREHNVLLLTRDIHDDAVEEWTDNAIRERTKKLAEALTEIWRVPPDHRVKPPQPLRKVLRIGLADLIVAGVLQSGMALIPRRKKHADRVAILLPDGRVGVDDRIFDNQTEAASYIAGKKVGGWWFFLVDVALRRSLRDIRNEYVNSMSPETEVEDADDDGEDEDE
jgi:hypothetical protein